MRQLRRILTAKIVLLHILERLRPRYSIMLCGCIVIGNVALHFRCVPSCLSTTLVELSDQDLLEVSELMIVAWC